MHLFIREQVSRRLNFPRLPSPSEPEFDGVFIGGIGALTAWAHSGIEPVAITSGFFKELKGTEPNRESVIAEEFHQFFSGIGITTQYRGADIISALFIRHLSSRPLPIGTGGIGSRDAS